MVYHPRDSRRLDVFNMRCQRCLMCAFFWQQHISNRSIRERIKQPTASYLLRQRRLRWFAHLLRMPSSLPARMVYDFNTNIMAGKDQEVAQKLDGLIPSSTTSILLASTPPMLPRWYVTDPFVSGLPTLEPNEGY